MPQFSHVYTEGPLANTGTWHFEAEWTTLKQPAGKRALRWRAKHESDTQWHSDNVELGYLASGSIDDEMVKKHVIGAFALRQVT